MNQQPLDSTSLSTRSQALLFITAMLLGGIGGMLGSMVGNTFGKTGLFAGGVVGGLLAAIPTAYVAVWRRWIAPGSRNAVTIGAALGFAAAAAIAVNTLSSPIGPVLSTLLVGIGAVLGARVGGR